MQSCTLLGAYILFVTLDDSSESVQRLRDKKIVISYNLCIKFDISNIYVVGPIPVLYKFQYRIAVHVVPSLCAY